MAERLEDLNLPNTVITRIIKEALPDGVNIAKEARTAFAKSASVYILYITSAASLVATSNNRKTISGQDVLQAIGNVEFNNFLEPLQDVLEYFRRMQKGKKDASAKRKMQKERKSEDQNGNEVGDKDNVMEADLDNGLETSSDVIYDCVDQ
ncbi:DNA polymerase epsilon subunit 3 [Cryptotermes secundus]|nr:DNA polymerase epsilon subunit 3 [Cryptotermes secundus]